MSFQGGGMGMSMAANNLSMNGAGNVAMNMNTISMSMNGANIGINPNNMASNMSNSMGSINPVYLAALQGAQHNPGAMSGMMGKFPSGYASYAGQNQQGQHSMNPSHSQIPTSSQMHPVQTPQTPNPSSSHIQNQSISPTQLMSASPSQLMGGPSSQQVLSQPLTLTPAQLLQQQQGGSINSSSLGGGNGNMNMGGMNPNLASLGGMGGMNMNMGAMNNMQGMQSMGNMNMSTAMNMHGMGHMGGVPNQGPNPNVRMNFPPGMTPHRYAQMNQQERAAFQRQQQAVNMGHGLLTERAPGPAHPVNRVMTAAPV
jgi:SWI/SNF-related matrix-associated actin-dependent regulator of chromatin subfamily B protein 1